MQKSVKKRGSPKEMENIYDFYTLLRDALEVTEKFTLDIYK